MNVTSPVKSRCGYQWSDRVTPSCLLKHLGLADRVSTTELTNHERDELLKMVYRFKWPDEQTELVIGVLSWPVRP